MDILDNKEALENIRELIEMGYGKEDIGVAFDFVEIEYNEAD